MSITSCGSVVVWSDVLTHPDEDSDYIGSDSTSSSSFRKEFIKSVKVGEHVLQVIRSVDTYVMISDALGHIRFYDSDLKILFWCPSNESIDSVITISFDLMWKSNEPNQLNDKTFSIRDFFVRKKISNPTNVRKF